MSQPPKKKCVYKFGDPSLIKSDLRPSLNPGEVKQSDAALDSKKQELKDGSVVAGKKQQQPANSKTEQTSNIQTQNKPPKPKKSDDLLIENDDQMLGKKQPQSKPIQSIAQQPKPNESKIQIKPSKNIIKQQLTQPATKVQIKNESSTKPVQKENKLKQKGKTQKQDDMNLSDDQSLMNSGTSTNFKKKQLEQSSIRQQLKPPLNTQKHNEIKKIQCKKQESDAIDQKSPVKKTQLNLPTLKRVSDKAEQDLCMDEDSIILENQGLPNFVSNRPMREFHNDLLENLKENKNIGPQMLRFAQIQQKYLKQLRILIELNKITENQLRLHRFNRDRYKELVNKKTIILEKYPIPSIISEETLSTDDFKKAFNELQKIQSQLTPLEDGFDEKNIRNLYAFPPEMLLKTRQELYEQMLQKEIQQLEKIYSETEKQTKQIETILQKKNAQLKDKKDVKQVQAKKRVDKLLQEHKEKTRKSVFPGSGDQNRIIQPEEFTQEYKVIIKNREEMNRKLEELKEDKEISELKSIIENLRKQRLKEQELLEKQKEKFEKYSVNKKKNLNKQVYMGDVQKMKNNTKVKKLEKEQKQLIKEYIQKKQMRAYRGGSRVNFNSIIKFVSRIEE